MSGNPRLGRKIQVLRRREGLTQAALAEGLGISASYLNLIEHDRRPVSANVLISLARYFDLDVKSFAASREIELTADLMEVFGDPIFEDQAPSETEAREVTATSPDVTKAILHLYQAYVAARGTVETLAEKVHRRQDTGEIELTAVPSEQVSDLIQRHLNYFPELEAEAEQVWHDAGLRADDVFSGLADYLDSRHGIKVRIVKTSETRGAVRRFHPDRGELLLSEVLRRGSRNFQLAHQIGLLNCSAILDRFARDPQLSSDESRALCRVALANYFSGAVLMPYDDFLRAAQEERYDIDLLGHRFRASFEQVCHRLTALQRPGAKGIPLHMARIDIAGNISKKFSATGIHFPRFSGLCPLWNVHAAFLRPGMIRVQLSRMPDGAMYFSLARTVRKHHGGHHAPIVHYAIELGTDTDSARNMVYTDGIDLTNIKAAVPVGSTCRLCDRMDCQARAFPSLQKPLRIDENVRGVSFFAPVVEG